MGQDSNQLRRSKIQHATSRFFIRRLISENPILVKDEAIHERAGRSHLTACTSLDDGENWSRGLLPDEREGVSYPMAYRRLMVPPASYMSTRVKVKSTS